MESAQIILKKISDIAKTKNITLTDIERECGFPKSSMRKWNENVPSISKVKKVADFLEVPIDYLANDLEIVITPSVKKTFFNTLLSLVQRWTSLRHGVKVSSEQLSEIVKYVNCDMRFVYNEQVFVYTPAEEYKKENLQNLKVLFDILDIMDRCADSDEYRALQIQLSRIVLYWLNKKGYTQEVLLQYSELTTAKLKFLYTNVPNKDITLNYGLNYTDLAFLREKTGLSFQYMFTGVEEDPIEMLKKEIEELRKSH
jgi:transcriptional regulator with XRE-family HTH domain